MISELTKEESKKNTVHVFIDASNLWQAQKARGRLFDYEKIKEVLKNICKATTLEIFYYTAYPANGTREYSLDNRHKFYTYLKKGLGFHVVKKELKRIYIQDKPGDHIQEKGNMDVEMTIDAVHNIEAYDTAVLFSGDSDFLALLTYIKKRNKKVFIFSSKNNISEELRTGADTYFDVLLLEEDIWRAEIEKGKS